MAEIVIPEPRNPLPKGGSSLLQIGITDEQSSEIWGDRYSHTVTDIDGSGNITIAQDYAADYEAGESFRLRNTSSNDGVVTISTQPTWDSNNSELAISVDETTSTETPPSDAVIEPVWVRGGWQPLAKNLGGGTLTESQDAERRKDEFGTEVGEVVNNQEIVIANEVMANGDRFYSLVKWLEGEFVEARYPLPRKQNGNFETIGGDRYADWRFFPRLSASSTDREESLNDDEQRSLSFEVVASKPESTSSFDEPQLRIYLNRDDDSGWPSTYSPWQDSAYSTTRATS